MKKKMYAIYQQSCEVVTLCGMTTSVNWPTGPKMAKCWSN